MNKKKYMLRWLPVFILCSLFIGNFFFQDLSETYGTNNKNGYEKLAEGKKVRYLVIGDSIGRGSGAESSDKKWFKLLEQKWKTSYGSSASGDYLVQSGATAFEGLYKLNHIRFFRDPDFIFIVFGENDRKYMNAGEFAALYENLLRTAKTRYPRAELITLTESCLKFEDFAKEITKVSEQYHAVHIDMRPVFARSGLTEQELTKDLVHPSGRGYGLYAEALHSEIDKQLRSGKQPVLLSKQTDWSQPWETRLIKMPENQSGFNLNGRFFSSSSNSASISYRFTGPLLGINVLRSPDGADIRVTIDDSDSFVISTWWPFARERAIYLASSLKFGEHTVRFESAGTLPNQNQSRKTVIQLGGIIVKQNAEK